MSSFSDDGSLMMFVDASNTGWGSDYFKTSRDVDRWTAAESEKHINILEANTLHLFLQISIFMLVILQWPSLPKRGCLRALMTLIRK